MTWALFFLALLVVIPSPAENLNSQFIVETALNQKLEFSRAWLNLVHYKKTWTGGYLAQPDGANFFLATEGKTNPKSELIASLREIINPSADGDLNARCRFPARTRWLKNELNLNLGPEPVCPKYFAFREKVRAKSATLVFSSYFINNPSSAFGHSLIRLNRGEQASGHESAQLLDYGINYAANMDTDNPILYAVKGIAGLFGGTFTAMPYYYKVRQYGDFESRDLWEYDLNLSPEEIEQFVAHIWEVGDIAFDYFYLSENCSYHMLSTLEAAAPRLVLTDKLPYWVIPADTIKVAWQHRDLVKDIQYRPSLHTQLKVRIERIKKLNLIPQFLELRQQKNISNFTYLSNEQQAELFDAVADDLDHRHAKALLDGDKELKAWKHKLLSERSRIPVSNPLNIPIPEHSQPHLSHGSSRVRFSILEPSEDEQNYEGGIRFSLHDLADPVSGYPALAKIEMFDFNFRYFPAQNDLQSQSDERFELKNIVLFQIETLSPRTQFDKAWAWRARLAFDRLYEDRCENDSCLAMTGSTGTGLAMAIDDAEKFLIFTQFGGDLQYSYQFSGVELIPTLGPAIGLRMQFTDRFIFYTRWEKVRMFTRSPETLTRGSAVLRFSPDLSWGYEASLRRDYKSEEFLVSLLRYF